MNLIAKGEQPVIRSMTGYGRKEVGDADVHLTIEIRSLNNRYLDIQLKAPRALAGMESRVKKSVQERFSRGRFDIFIARNGEQERSGRLVVNEALAGQYIGALRDLKSRFGLGGDVELSMVAGFKDIVTIAETNEDPEAVWQVLSRGLAQALDELERMRAEEGAALADDILARLDEIESLVAKIRTKAPATVELARKRMTETLGRLLSEQPDPVRVAQEIAILAERTDVTEELTRLASHLSQFRAVLKEPSPEGVGRRLDFLIQEMGRETNTIASKAMDADISLDVVHIKAELEKVREQVQNIE
jgi:uncharacterized protein (TIGR00255 family)